MCEIKKAAYRSDCSFSVIKVYNMIGQRLVKVLPDPLAKIYFHVNQIKQVVGLGILQLPVTEVVESGLRAGPILQNEVVPCNLFTDLDGWEIQR